MSLLATARFAVVGRFHQRTLNDVHRAISKRPTHPVGMSAGPLESVWKITAAKLLLVLHPVGITRPAHRDDVANDFGKCCCGHVHFSPLIHATKYPPTAPIAAAAPSTNA
jgi:hypothetical protein